MNPHLPSDSPLPSAFFHTDALPTDTVRPSAEAAVPTDIHTHRLPEQPGSAVVTVDPTTEGGLPEHQCCSVGIHPWHTDGDWERTGMPRVERLAGEDRVVAIGECGLDKVWLKRLPAGERDGAFRRQTEALLPGAVCRAPAATPVVGAVLCVLQEDAGADIDDPALLERIRKEAGGTL